MRITGKQRGAASREAFGVRALCPAFERGGLLEKAGADVQKEAQQSAAEPAHSTRFARQDSDSASREAFGVRALRAAFERGGFLERAGADVQKEAQQSAAEQAHSTRFARQDSDSASREAFGVRALRAAFECGGFFEKAGADVQKEAQQSAAEQARSKRFARQDSDSVSREAFGVRALCAAFERGGLLEKAGADVQKEAQQSAAEPAHSTRFAREGACSESGSLLIIVLWIALGLVTITLYFASSMTFELRASDNRVSGVSADQAVEAGARYVSAVLQTFGTNGAVPPPDSYLSQAVPVGDSHFWLIGRASSGNYQLQPDEVFFGLVDEASKLNLNTAGTNLLQGLTNMSAELAANIVDWRNTNGTVSLNGDGPSVYSTFQPPYQCKNAPYETVDELRLVYPTDLGTLMGEDLNRNGALDPSESDTNHNGAVDCGPIEYTTVYSREPNTRAGGGARINVSVPAASRAELTSLLQTNLGSARATQVLNSIGLGQTGGSRQGTAGRGASGASTPTMSFASPLAFYVQSGMTADEFSKIEGAITVAGGNYIYGRINVNTASPAVLACLPGLSASDVQQLQTYREMNSSNLTSIAWVADALGRNSASLRTLGAGDYLTTHSYQFTADIAALGPYGRGYRRAKFIFDTTSGVPQIIYRQDLTYLGWALGRYVRQDYLQAGSRSNL